MAVGPGRRTGWTVPLVLLGVVLAACTSGATPAAVQPPAAGTPSPSAPSPTPGSSSPGSASEVTPVPTPTPSGRGGVEVRTLVSGLDIPWDVTFTPDGTMLFDERGGGFSALRPDGELVRIEADLSDLWVAGETGLMGMVVDPSFASNRTVYTCMGHLGGVRDVRVVAWTLDAGYTRAVRVPDPVVTGIDITTGRHGGCRLRFDQRGTLVIGTGDAAVGSHPQDLGALNGKILRVTTSGAPAPDNPFLESDDPATRLVFSYGHRNVQGLALRPGTGQVWTVEHGAGVEDEINAPVSGGNFGYDPVPVDGPGYDESVPMTDPALGQVQEAVATSGATTAGWSGATWIDGPQWGELDGALAVAALGGESLQVFRIDRAGAVRGTSTIAELSGTHGRLRTVQSGPDGALYVTTSNGGGRDEILRVAPAA
ncbi:PQQ-dependent sugar dehydrogenase [Nakamurella sp. YIM 132087]|uniref:PQQ-dependent sugar dehydrogenase n=1 Tax=Nakamurella alba TaxID=2665158 RepID=A0A7K1FM89_9ACTN|nr:PQQ-dependent sugar dehydrogenase [Nakamurella alba]MTD15272.1 PQQ-dependent sugar dehydrogenase [Nakamurella alba]